jgi:aspartate kinase
MDRLTSVHKFGGASVRDADGVRNLAHIISSLQGQRLLIVISAMGKTTNALESILSAGQEGRSEEALAQWNALELRHLAICNELFPEGVPEDLQRTLEAIGQRGQQLIGQPDASYDRAYDQMVGLGELFSTRIVSAFFAQNGLPNQWIDARDLIKTDSRHREAHVDWQATEQNISNGLPEKDILVTQGFIASDLSGTTTTLGREGSDYSAAVFAYCLKAKKVSIWKDVPGILNADPRYFPDAVLLDRLSYDEAIELAYHGATVIHPRTIQPLKEKNIVLEVKSFKQPDSAGTRIEDGLTAPPPLPCFIRKSRQAFIQLHRKDLTFMAEEHLSAIYRIFDAHKTRVHLSAHSAVSSAFSIDQDPRILSSLEREFCQHFDVVIQTDLHLYTIRHYTEDSIKRIEKEGMTVHIQKSSATCQLLLKPHG